MTVHDNSIKAHIEEKPKFQSRRERAYLCYLRHGRMTDRQCLEHMAPGQEMNWIRPRVTNLLKEGRLIEVGSAIDPVSGKTVRVCEAVPDVEPKDIKNSNDKAEMRELLSLAYNILRRVEKGKSERVDYFVEHARRFLTR